MGYVASPDGFLVKFTGQSRDAETSTQGTSLDWFQVRTMSGGQGRFQSPDPANAGADLLNPQSWNGYAYVGNNPLTFTDPSGMCEATCIGAIGGPEGAVIGAIVDILGAIFGSIFGGGGGHPPPPVTVPPALATPSSPVLGSADSDIWNEHIPGMGSGSINTGGIFGSGNTSPFVFSYTSGIHEDISDNAAVAAGWDPREAFVFGLHVADVDKGTQGLGPNQTHIHAMGGQLPSGGHEGCAQAYAGTAGQLQKNIDRAAAGDEGALWNAAHTIQDSYDTAHQYQPWNGHYTFAHFRGDVSGVGQPEATAATTRLLQGLAGKIPLGKAADYLYRPRVCR
jgi:RHS repeat-associated protein